MGWPERHRAAISLSFDDARPSQLRWGFPLLEHLGVAATFFVLPNAVSRHRGAWRQAVAAGHEIGNHTTTHPCSANFPWSRHNPIEDMSLADFSSDVDEANRRLGELVGVEPTVFAYPCGHTSVGRGQSTASVVPLIAQRFEVGRTFNDVTANSPADVDLAQTRCVASDEKTLEALTPLLEATLADGAWLVLGGHEIGAAGTRETTWIETIEAVVRWARSNDVWIDTIGNVAPVIEAFRRPAVRGPAAPPASIR